MLIENQKSNRKISNVQFQPYTISASSLASCSTTTKNIVLPRENTKNCNQCAKLTSKQK